VKGSIGLADYSVRQLKNEWRNALLLFPRNDAFKNPRNRTARFDRAGRAESTGLDVNAKDLTKEQSMKKYVMLFRSAKETSEWVRAFREAFSAMGAGGGGGGSHAEGEDEEGDVAFTVSSHLAAEQAKFLDLKNRIDGFAKVFGHSFHQKCIEVGEVRVSKGKGGVGHKIRTIVIFEDVMVIAKRNPEAKSAKKSLGIEKKFLLADVTVLVTPAHSNDPTTDAALAYLVVNPRDEDPLLFRAEADLAMRLSQAMSKGSAHVHDVMKRKDDRDESR